MFIVDITVVLLLTFVIYAIYPRTLIVRVLNSSTNYEFWILNINYKKLIPIPFAFAFVHCDLQRCCVTPVSYYHLFV